MKILSKICVRNYSSKLLSNSLFLYSAQIHQRNTYFINNSKNSFGISLKKSHYFSSEKKYTQQDVQQLMSLRKKAEQYYYQRQYSLAREALIKSGLLIAKIKGEKDLEYARITNNIGITHKIQRNFEQAKKYFQKSINILQSLDGNYEIQKAQTKGELGQIYFIEKQFDKSIEYLTYTSTTMEKHSLQTLQLATIYGMLGIISRETTKFEQAISYYQKQLVLLEKIKGGKSFEVLYCLNEIGHCFAHISKFDEALIRFKRIQDIQKDEKFQNKDNNFQNEINIAMCYKKLGKFNQFASSIESVIQKSQQINGKDHPNNAQYLQKLGIAYFQQRQLDKALPHLQKFKHIVENMKDKGDRLWNYGSVLFILGNIYRHKLNYSQALKHYLASLEIINSKDHAGHAANILCFIGQLYYAQQQYQLSLNYYLNALQSYEVIYGKQSHKNHNLYLTLGEVYRKLQKTKQSEQFQQLANRVMESQIEDQNK